MSDNREINVHIDKAHADKPVHVDVTKPFDDHSGAHKIEVDTQGNITRQEIWVGKDHKEI